MKRGYLERRLLDTVSVRAHASARRSRVTEVSLDFRDAVVSSEQAFPQQTLQNTSHARSMYQLQHKQVRLYGRDNY